MSYTFLDAYSSVQTAASSVVAGVQQPIVQISSFLSAAPVLISGSIAGNVTVSNQVSVIGTVSVVGTISVSNPASIVGLYAPVASFISGVTSVMTGTSSVQVLAPAAGGQRNYITNVLVTNAAASGTTVQLIDGGTVIYVGYAAPSGGGFSATFPTPLRQSSIAGNLSALSSIQASVYVSASGFTAP